MSRFHDISMPVYQGMLAWPTDPRVKIEPFKELAAGKSSNVSAVYMGTHSGTHIDPPAHFFPDGATVDELPLAAMLGPAVVLEINDEGDINDAVLNKFNWDGVERVLLKTSNSKLMKATEFQGDYVHLDKSGAEFLVKQGVKLVGIDYLSIDGYGNKEAPVHHTLLSQGVIVLESIDLSSVQPGRYELICLPLRLAAGNGGPARAVLIEA